MYRQLVQYLCQRVRMLFQIFLCFSLFYSSWPAGILEDIKSLADRLSSKFHSFCRCFTSWPTVHFSDNLSAVNIISSDIPSAGRGLFTKCTHPFSRSKYYLEPWLKCHIHNNVPTHFLDLNFGLQLMIN